MINIINYSLFLFKPFTNPKTKQTKAGMAKISNGILLTFLINLLPFIAS